MIRPSVIIFDFDGVILESVSVKTEAFRQLFSFSPEHVDEIVLYHLDNGGMSRFEKFRHIFKNILHQEISRKRFDDLSQQFSDLVEDKVANAPFVVGALEFLQTQHATYSLYIVSATPEDELRRIVHSRNISQYFQGVFGSPVKKIDHIQRILTDNKLLSLDVIFVGDAINDEEAAKTAGVRFIGRENPGAQKRFNDIQGIEYIIEDIRDLSKYLSGPDL
ncbi:MAG: HAD hydrolase-like protein [Methanoregula sp.]|nr:HAD hydrolase-like protein [Methanoregula sp.]